MPRLGAAPAPCSSRLPSLVPRRGRPSPRSADRFRGAGDRGGVGRAGCGVPPVPVPISGGHGRCSIPSISGTTRCAMRSRPGAARRGARMGAGGVYVHHSTPHWSRLAVRPSDPPTWQVAASPRDSARARGRALVVLNPRRDRL
ncbi:MAG: hypothetical protein AVDCRST_MAG73-2399 [uncultured Thermomicrobiales bacterium]|uniref:Uncharacterized protein n=1 Tax=uncultured Thermomicrobiales bacterium TaxID=1645740 RepID=A0A6J4UF71_9BACT|nr:MAG: hypothetical protein AVDCRST_MAG73-2399 [uncultured Thermomicrobiales bacterium]